VPLRSRCFLSLPLPTPSPLPSLMPIKMNIEHLHRIHIHIHLGGCCYVWLAGGYDRRFSQQCRLPLWGCPVGSLCGALSLCSFPSRGCMWHVIKVSWVSWGGFLLPSRPVLMWSFSLAVEGVKVIPALIENIYEMAYLSKEKIHF
jgi:hypothetical protein